MKTKITFVAIALAFFLNSNAQLKVYAPLGNIGIDATNPLSRFTVGGDGFSDARVAFHNNITTNNSKTLRIYTPLPTSTYIYGLVSSFPTGNSTGQVNVAILASAYRGSTSSNGQGVGVRSQAGNALSGYNYAMLAELLGSNDGAAIYATTPGKSPGIVPGLYAGYFRGKVYIENDLQVAGVFYPSDINLKKNVVELEKNNIDKIKQLSAIRYNLKNPIEMGAFSQEASDTGKVTFSETELNDPKYTRNYIGISAQELQKVYPEIVKQEENGYLSVNYIELIPVLMEAIKEQQAVIEELKRKIDTLSAKKE